MTDYEEFDIENFPSNETAKEMLHMVSEEFYEKSYVGKWLFQVMGIEWHEIKEKLEELPDQFFMETATWGLKWHEIKWQLPIREYLPNEERRMLLLQKRDYRAPMTPYKMEQMIGDSLGRTIHISDIHDAGEDGYIPEHPNVFRVTLEVGSEPVNIGEVLQKLRKVKQSHTTFTFRVTTAVKLLIGVDPKSYRVVHRLCGTYPKISTGWRLLTSGIELDITAGGTKTEPPLSGVSGETGQYPKTSTGLKITNDLVELQTSGKGQGVKYALSGEGETGQFPKTSTGFVKTNGGIIAEASGQGSRTEYVAAGTVPGVSTGAGSAANSLVPGVTTESFKVTYPLCGSAFEI